MDKNEISSSKKIDASTKLNIIEKIFTQHLEKKNLRKTPERFVILREVYKFNQHFTADYIYEYLQKKNYRISRATIYNTMDLLIELKIVRKHQRVNPNQAEFEPCFFNQQHDHIYIESKDKVIEFCDPRIELIKKDLENMYNVKINSHTLYFYATDKEE